MQCSSFDTSSFNKSSVARERPFDASSRHTRSPMSYGQAAYSYPNLASAISCWAAQAEVGDDVYGEDPSVNRLQHVAAEMLGMEAALFVSSGTMGNLSAVLAHCEQRGCEVRSACQVFI